MSYIAKGIGYVYIVVWVLSQCGQLDMVVCVGKPGACATTATKVR